MSKSLYNLFTESMPYMFGGCGVFFVLFDYRKRAVKDL